MVNVKTVKDADKVESKPIRREVVCENCGTKLAHEGGCLFCYNCGWSKCG